MKIRQRVGGREVHREKDRKGEDAKINRTRRGCKRQKKKGWGREWKKYDHLLPRKHLFLSLSLFGTCWKYHSRGWEKEKKINTFDYDHKYRCFANSHLSTHDVDYARACIETRRSSKHRQGGGEERWEGDQAIKRTNAAECTFIIRATYFLARASKDVKYVWRYE